VKDAVADGLLDTRRWESCSHLATGDDDRAGPDDDDDGIPLRRSPDAAADDDASPDAPEPA